MLTYSIISCHICIYCLSLRWVNTLHAWTTNYVKKAKSNTFPSKPDIYSFVIWIASYSSLRGIFNNYSQVLKRNGHFWHSSLHAKHSTWACNCHAVVMCFSKPSLVTSSQSSIRHTLSARFVIHWCLSKGEDLDCIIHMQQLWHQ